jgi:hypothetical protein
MAELAPPPVCPDCGKPAVAMEASSLEVIRPGEIGRGTIGPLDAPPHYQCEDGHWFLEDGSASSGPIEVVDDRRWAW